MTYSDNLTDSEFAFLCKSQIELLTQGLGAIWSAVYLTDDVTEDCQKKLLLFEVHSQTTRIVAKPTSESELQEILQQVGQQFQLQPSRLLADKNQQQNEFAIAPNAASLMTKQLVLPLVHEEVALGLLITVREDRFWHNRELEQVKEIANTLAIGYFLDKQSQWYRQQLKQQEDLRNWEREQLGNLLHQLRNPLTALRTFSKLLVKRLLPEDRNRNVAEQMLQESDRLKNLIDRFAGEVTTESKPITLGTTSIRLKENQTPSNFLLPSNTSEPTAVDLNQLLEPLLQAASAISDERNIELVGLVASKLPPVKGDIAGLREVFNNLLDNALKYTPAPGKVILRSIQQDSLVGIAIEDNGYGISDIDQEHLFERHYRGAQEQSEIPGTGLGLAIAKQLIEQMGGDIEVISPNPKLDNSNLPGTIFTVWLSVID